MSKVAVAIVIEFDTDKMPVDDIINKLEIMIDHDWLQFEFNEFNGAFTGTIYVDDKYDEIE